MSRLRRRPVPRAARFAFLALTTLPALVQAHPGHGGDSGAAAGAWHALSGLDHLAGLLVAGLLLGALRHSRLRWLACAGFLTLTGITHVAWLVPDAGGAFVLGLLAASAAAVAAGMAATRLALTFSSGAPRRRTSAAAAAPTRHRHDAR